METLNIAILGCGTVGGGVARIITDINNDLALRAQKKINITKIVELYPKNAAERFGLPLDMFCGNADTLTSDEAQKYIQEIISSDEIDLVVETIGGKSDFVYNTCLEIIKSGKHLVTANKALLAERGNAIFNAAEANNLNIGFEAAVCGAIPIIKTINESFTGDKILSVSGILNGTSNYILTQMQGKRLGFAEALKLAQQQGYAEADPSLDINGGDAGHKLILLVKLAFGMNITMDELSITGIENITMDDIDFANEIDARIKLICYAKQVNGEIFATVKPMLVKNSNFLAKVDDATNAVRLNNKYSGVHFLVGKGAGSSETAMSIVSDIVFIARYGEQIIYAPVATEKNLADARRFVFPYLITFNTVNIPGTTGFIATAIGNQNINIDTVSHNRYAGEEAMFSLATMPCTLEQIEKAIDEIEKEKPGMLLGKPKILPILY